MSQKPLPIALQTAKNQMTPNKGCQQASCIRNNNCRSGPWTQKETIKYFLFLYHHRSKFSSKTLRKSLKVFKQMAKFIQSRNSSQCRTHYQNLMSKSESFDSALNAFISQTADFYFKYEQSKDSLQLLEDIDFCEGAQTVLLKHRSTNASVSEQEVKIQDKNSQKQMQSTLFSSSLSSFSQIFHENFEFYRNAQFQRRNQIIQCHSLFKLWVEKVSRLTGIRAV